MFSYSDIGKKKKKKKNVQLKFAISRAGRNCLELRTDLSRDDKIYWKKEGVRLAWNSIPRQFFYFPQFLPPNVLFGFAAINLEARQNFRFHVRKLQPFISRYASTLINENVGKKFGVEQ